MSKKIMSGIAMIVAADEEGVDIANKITKGEKLDELEDFAVMTIANYLRQFIGGRRNKECFLCDEVSPNEPHTFVLVRPDDQSEVSGIVMVVCEKCGVKPDVRDTIYNKIKSRSDHTGKEVDYLYDDKGARKLQ